MTAPPHAAPLGAGVGVNASAGPVLGSTRELAERVAERERDLRAAIEDLGDALETAVDWKRVVQEHPIESALGVAALGFLVGYRPSLLSRPGDAVLKALAEAGADAIARAVASG